MHRTPKSDSELDRLSEERDHLAIQLSLARDAETVDPHRLSALQRQLAALEAEISRYKPAEVAKLHRTRLDASARSR